ncbi:hypothetical protein [Chryseobacterium sp. G0201]|uniref:hypothetical protein n=1 Tax=Chryseobacterium sp. G0201 TaxID=2487065 RepID=UPI000F4D6FDA|nr:hypothetical protein [Chryseobacterium sp. G0201]AZA52743.1 hypothetical protein EG348_06860 [Chryseobacterium sp. G0201]
MKKIIFHSVSVLISLIWLVKEHQTYNPITLKGPDFLKFYFILLLGFYVSVIILTFFKETISKITIYFMIFIMVLGIVKLIRGMILVKPFGYLLVIMFFEVAVLIYFMLFYSNKKLK